MSLLLNDKGEMNKGFEILVRQLLKMMNLDPALVIGQISGIHGAFVRHVAQQDEIIQQNTRIIELLEKSK